MTKDMKNPNICDYVYQGRPDGTFEVRTPEIPVTLDNRKLTLFCIKCHCQKQCNIYNATEYGYFAKSNV